MKSFKINAKKCAGCRLCQMACSFKHHGEFSLELSNVRVHCIEDTADFTPKNCIQCEDRNCIKICPTNALSFDESTGAVLIDQDSCIQCGLCIDACSYSGIGMIEKAGQQQISVCDLCGGDPECVKVCREKALGYDEA